MSSLGARLHLFCASYRRRIMMYTNSNWELGRKFGSVASAIPLNMLEGTFHPCTFMSCTNFSFSVFQSMFKCQRGECTQRGSWAVSVQFIRGPRVLVYFSSSSEVYPLHGFSLCFFTGGQCGCSSYSTLLYAVSSAVAVLLLLLLLIGFVMIYKVSTLIMCCSDVTPD